MRRVLIAISVIIMAIIGVTAIVLWVMGPGILTLFIRVPSTEDAYPHAPPMPAIVATPVDGLLSQYEAFLTTKAPLVFGALQPGLTDSQINGIETKYSLNLPPDLRALYRWRDGTPRTAALTAFPDHDFVSLQDALANREDLRKQVKAGTSVQQRVFATYAGHRDPWLGLIVDAAGDGYLFDPARSEAQGSFFFCFAEDGEYVFFPSFRNYLMAVVEGQKTGIFVSGRRGIETADFVKAQELWCRYGVQRAR